MTMLYVRRAISTIQGGVDVELSPKTLLLGPNASGKSRVRRSLEIALKGTASDIAGRDEVAKGIELLTLATPGQDLKAQAFLSNGTECRYELRRKVSGKKGEKFTSSETEPIRPPTVDPTLVFPLWTLRDAILGAAGTARKFFLSHAVRTVARSDVLSRLPNALHELYEKAVHATGIQVNRPEIDKLLSASEYAGKRAGEATRESNATKKTVTESGQGLPPPPTEAESAEAAAAVERARTALEAAVAGYQINSRRQDLSERLSSVNGRLDAARARLTTAQQHLAYVESEVAKLPAVADARAAVPVLVHATRTTINALLDHAAACATACGVCGRWTDGQDGSVVDWTARAALAQQELARHEEAAKAAQATLDWTIKAHAKADEYLTGARFDVQQATGEIETLSAQAQQLTEALGAAPESSETLTIENARAVVAAAEERQRQLDLAKAAWESTRKMRDNALSAESESNKWHQLSDACTDVIRDLLDKGVADFCARVQLYLPPTDRFSLRLRDGGREVCQFGLVRGEALYTVLSGAEWARVTAALAAVCGPTSEDRLAVVCPHQLGERAFDPKTLTEVMMALGKIPQQVILESPVRPALIPAGWSIVEVEELAKEAARRAAPPPPRAAPEPPPAPKPPPPFAR